MVMKYQKAIVAVAYNPIQRENVTISTYNIYIKRACFLLTYNANRNLCKPFIIEFFILIPTYLIYNKNFIIQMQ
jgi:hypothetical protein